MEKTVKRRTLRYVSNTINYKSNKKKTKVGGSNNGCMELWWERMIKKDLIDKRPLGRPHLSYDADYTYND